MHFYHKDIFLYNKCGGIYTPPHPLYTLFSSVQSNYLNIPKSYRTFNDVNFSNRLWWCSATDWCYYGFTKFNPAPVSSRIDMMHNPGPYHIWKFRKFLRYLHCHIYLCIYDSNTGIISLCSDRVNSDLGLLPVFYWVFIPRPLGHWFGKCFGEILLIYDFFKPLLDTYICNSFTIRTFSLIY